MGCMQGWGSFNLLQGEALCPECAAAFKPLGCVFVSCAWMYDGRKLGYDGQLQYCHSDWQASSRSAACSKVFLGSPCT